MRLPRYDLGHSSSNSLQSATLQPSSRLQNLRHVAGDGLFEVARLSVEGFEFLVQGFELFLEVLVAHGFARRDAHVAAGIERPALHFNFFERRGFA